MDGLRGREFGEGRLVETLEPGVVLERFEVTRETLEEAAAPEHHVFGALEQDVSEGADLPEGCDSAAACQLALIRQLCGVEAAAQPWLEWAQAEGWMIPECGMPMCGADALLRAAGLHAGRIDDCSAKELLEILADGEKAICSVSSALLEYPQAADWPGVSADRFVQVLGADMRDAENARVCLYDPLRGDVRVYPMQDFIAAWTAGGRRLVFAY